MSARERRELVEASSGAPAPYAHMQMGGPFNPYPGLPVVLVRTIIFSGGECHVKVKDWRPYDGLRGVVVSSRLATGTDIMQLMLCIDALGHLGVPAGSVHVVLPYIPYARQDRVCDAGESFSLRVFSKLLNSLGLGKVTMVDAHSDVAPALIDNSVNVSNCAYVRQALEDIGGTDVLIVSPDSGANKKVHKLVKDLGTGNTVIACDKERDPATGALSGFQVFADDLGGRDCLIVDDICDGGRTFIGVATELRKKNAGDIYLFVTHGIFSAGFTDLSIIFKKVYCTDSFSTVSNELVKQFPINLELAND